MLPKLKLDNKKEDEWVAEWQRIRVLGGAPVVEQVMLLPGAQKCRTLAEVLLLVRKYVEDGEKRDRAGKLVAIHNLFPQLQLPEEKPKLDALFTAWDAFTRNGGIQALRRAQQARPNLSPPGDPQAALMMLLAPMPNPAVAALRAVDYLDRIVAADPAVVSQQNQQAIQQMRADIVGNRVQGNPQTAVTRLTDTVIAAAVPVIKGRFDALERRMPERTWQDVESLWFTNLFSGKLMDAIDYLRQLEASLPTQAIR